MKSVYHEKELVDMVLTMSRKLEEHITGTGVHVRRMTLAVVVLCCSKCNIMFIVSP